MTDLFGPQPGAVAADWPENAGDQFWALWPAGPRKHSKKQVFAKLARISRAREATWDEVIRGLRAYIASKPDPQYIPAPMVWLNQQRWMADYSGTGKRRTFGDVMIGR